MAADYADEIRRVQPFGPYSLIGWSLGGLIGSLVAAELGRRGERVDCLAMVDSFVPWKHGPAERLEVASHWTDELAGLLAAVVPAVSITGVQLHAGSTKSAGVPETPASAPCRQNTAGAPATGALRGNRADGAVRSAVAALESANNSRIVGFRRISRSLISMPKLLSCRSLATTFRLRIELPPSSKNLSVTPTCGSLSISDQRCADRHRRCASQFSSHCHQLCRTEQPTKKTAVDEIHGGK